MTRSPHKAGMTKPHSYAKAYSMTDDIEMTITPSCGNVFADLGLPDADELLAKANLALHIRGVIKVRKLTQSQAAKIIGIDQPKVSSIINGRLDGYSTDRLMKFLNELGCDVHISVSAPHPETYGHVTVTPMVFVENHAQ